jgi:hypothetical protein
MIANLEKGAMHLGPERPSFLASMDKKFRSIFGGELSSALTFLDKLSTVRIWLYTFSEHAKTLSIGLPPVTITRF